MYLKDCFSFQWDKSFFSITDAYHEFYRCLTRKGLARSNLKSFGSKRLICSNLSGSWLRVAEKSSFCSTRSQRLQQQQKITYGVSPVPPPPKKNGNNRNLQPYWRLWAFVNLQKHLELPILAPPPTKCMPWHHSEKRTNKPRIKRRDRVEITIKSRQGRKGNWLK